MKPLPIGTQNFPKLIETGLLYVDKTASFHCMIQEGQSTDTVRALHLAIEGLDNPHAINASNGSL